MTTSSSNIRGLAAVLAITVFAAIGFLIGGLKARYDFTHAQPVPAHALGVFACGQLWSVVVSDSKGGIYAATPHSEGSAAVLAAAKTLPPTARSVVTLEIPCKAPDSSADQR